MTYTSTSPSYRYRLYDSEGRLLYEGQVFKFNVVDLYGGHPIVEIQGYGDAVPGRARSPAPAPRCECGSEKSGSPVHSGWCPKAGP